MTLFQKYRLELAREIAHETGGKVGRASTSTGRPERDINVSKGSRYLVITHGHGELKDRKATCSVSLFTKFPPHELRSKNAGITYSAKIEELKASPDIIVSKSIEFLNTPIICKAFQTGGGEKYTQEMLNACRDMGIKARLGVYQNGIFIYPEYDENLLILKSLFPETKFHVDRIDEESN